MKASFETSDYDKRIILLSLSGECNIEDCAKISDLLNEIISREKYNIILRMSRVTFISSPFLGKLMGCKLRLKEKDGNIVMEGLEYQVREKLTMMGANRVFKFFLNLSTAYNFFEWDFNERSQIVKLSIPPNLYAIPPVRRLIARISMQKGYSKKDSFRIETIVDEIGNNAIEHGNSSQQKVDMEFQLDKKQLQLFIRNTSDAESVDKFKVLLDSIPKITSDEEVRGRGMAMVKLISSKLNISLKDNIVEVQVTKFREEG